MRKFSSFLVSRKTVLAVTLALITGVFSHQLFLRDTLSHFVMGDIDIQADNDVFIYFRMSNGIKKEAYEEWQKSAPAIAVPVWRNIRSDMGNRISPVLGVETMTPARIHIKNIIFRSYFANDMRIRHHQLSSLLQSYSPGTTITDGREWITIENDTNPIKVVFSKPLRFSNLFIQYFMPLVLAIGMFFLVKKFDPHSIPAIRDIFQRNVGNHKFRVELDGLRGVAALLVLLEHSLTPAPGSGRTGVWLFFILSGYLLSQPFVTKPERAVDLQYLTRYFRRRLARILPMYYVTVIVMFGFTGRYDTLANHFVFFYTEAHLWTIAQEMLFYLLLPIIMIIVYFVAMLRHWTVIPLMGIVSVALIFRPEIVPFNMYASGILLPPYIGWFLVGTFISFSRPERIQAWLGNKDMARFAVSSTAFLVLLTIIAFSFPQLTFQMIDLPRFLTDFLRSPPHFALVCVALFPLVLATPGSIVSRILSLDIFRAVGIVGYSFYLLHPMMIDITKGVTRYYFGHSPENLALAFPAALLTWAAAVFTYSFVERPFLIGPARPTTPV